VARKPRTVRWLHEPEAQDFEAARSYLSLLISEARLDATIERLRGATAGRWRAKDILRASGLPPLRPRDSEEVAEKAARIRGKKPLSPILLIVLAPGAGLEVADGYHRTCAAYRVHEDTRVPGRILFV
jgi:hypothetical protein